MPVRELIIIIFERNQLSSFSQILFTNNAASPSTRHIERALLSSTHFFSQQWVTAKYTGNVFQSPGQV